MRRSTALLTLLIWTAAASAEPPNLDRLFPAGARRGETVEVAAAGRFDHWPVRGWASVPGVEVAAADAKGKLTICVAADTPPGVLWLRLCDDGGATAPRPFVVGTLPEVLEVEPNDDPRGPQRLGSAAVTVNGRLARPGDVDVFAVRLSRGQTLVASLEANRRLGAPIDGVLQVVAPEGFVIAQNDDDHDRDPQIVFEAPADGEWIVRVFAFPATPDSSIRFAGEACLYRLTLTTGGFLDHVYPLAVSRHVPGRVEAIGWNIPEDARRLPVVAGDEAETARIAHPRLGNAVDVGLVSVPAVVEAEPNGVDRPQSITLPVAVSGRIDPPGDVDAYQFAARKGEPLAFRVESRSLGQPLDPVLRLTDAAGKVLAEKDDSPQGRDAELRFTAPDEGSYRVTVRDLNGRGGVRYAYLLSGDAPRPDFALKLKADRFTLTPGRPLEVPVAVERREGFDGPITVGLAEPGDGLTAEPVVSAPKGDSAKTVTLKLMASERVPSGPIRIVGTTGDGRRRAATAPIPGFAATIETVWLTVLPGTAK